MTTGNGTPVIAAHMPGFLFLTPEVLHGIHHTVNVQEDDIC